MKNNTFKCLASAVMSVLLYTFITIVSCQEITNDAGIERVIGAALLSVFFTGVFATLSMSCDENGYFMTREQREEQKRAKERADRKMRIKQREQERARHAKTF